MFLFARRLRDVVCLQYPQWFRPPCPPTYLLAPLSTTPSPAPSFLFFPLSPESLQDAMNGLQLTPAAGQQHEPDQGKTEQWENRSACNFHPEFPKDGDNDDGGKARRGTELSALGCFNADCSIWLGVCLQGGEGVYSGLWRRWERFSVTEPGSLSLTATLSPAATIVHSQTHFISIFGFMSGGGGTRKSTILTVIASIHQKINERTGERREGFYWDHYIRVRLERFFLS